MRVRPNVTILFGALLLAGASPAAGPALGPTLASAQQSFGASLSGEQANRESQGTGEAFFELNEAGTELAYRLEVGKLADINVVHIHMAARGANGPPVAWLHPAGGPPPALLAGEQNGQIAEGVIRSENLVGPLQGQPLSALIDALRAEGAYVNVHTAAVPGGEVRGQIGPR